jgi:6-phosphogluconolactonase
MKRKGFVAVLAAAILIFPTAGVSAQGQQDQQPAGAVYTMTNDATDNQVVIFNRADDGTLTRAASISTGGKGSGGVGADPLGSQGSIALSSDAQFLLVVNAGSHEISVFRVLPSGGLALVHKVDSGGVFPVSVTVSQNVVYVLNAGVSEHSPNITGFTLNPGGKLTPLPDSTRPVIGGPIGGFAQVGFDPQGKRLVVTDKGDSAILVYSVGDDGLPALSPVVSTSHGLTPFGFVFDGQGHLLVVEVGPNAVSSYNILPDDTLQVISPSVADGQKASCWIAGNDQGNVFTANPGTHDLSAFTENVGSGTIALLAGVAGQGHSPLDLSIAAGRFLYAVDPAGGGVDTFRIEENGSLTSLGAVAGGLSVFSQGIAAR